MKWYRGLFSFDTGWYYHNTTYVLLIAANSAINPVLYFWRMFKLRENTLFMIRKVTGRQKYRRPQNLQMVENGAGPANPVSPSPRAHKEVVISQKVEGRITGSNMTQRLLGSAETNV